MKVVQWRYNDCFKPPDNVCSDIYLFTFDSLSDIRLILCYTRAYESWIDDPDLLHSHFYGFRVQPLLPLRLLQPNFALTAPVYHTRALLPVQSAVLSSERNYQTQVIRNRTVMSAGLFKISTRWR